MKIMSFSFNSKKKILQFHRNRNTLNMSVNFLSSIYITMQKRSQQSTSLCVYLFLAICVCLWVCFASFCLCMTMSVCFSPLPNLHVKRVDSCMSGTGSNVAFIITIIQHVYSLIESAYCIKQSFVGISCYFPSMKFF